MRLKDGYLRWFLIVCSLHHKTMTLIKGHSLISAFLWRAAIFILKAELLKTRLDFDFILATIIITIFQYMCLEWLYLLDCVVDRAQLLLH